MSQNLNKSQVARYSRQIILRNIGALGQKKIIKSKVLIIGMGGLGCSVAEFLTRAGVGLSVSYTHLTLPTSPHV